MSSNESSEKTEPASQFKLQEARKKGQAAKSIEVVSLITLLGFLMMLLAFGKKLINRVLHNTSSMMGSINDVNSNTQNVLAWISSSISDWVSILAPIMLATAIFAILGNVLQTGLIFSTATLKPDFKKLNPISGLKKIFSIKSIFDLFKSVLKISILIAFLTWYVAGAMESWVGLLGRNPASTADIFIDFVVEIFFMTAPIVALFALIDFIFSKKKFLKDMRMTKHEVKEEHKRRDGDPTLKRKRKELQKELRDKQSGLNNVPTATVVITNPTHFSVALKYDAQVMMAPKVVAKGRGNLALKIRDIARSKRVKIIQSPALTRSIYKQSNIDDYIPSDTYLAVAKLLSKLEQSKSVVR
ncbi:EscU/YscU/HrcU family type III secretion system export apparatus switch protein [Microbulbifer sp. ANSA005]|uniref:EscU/YscU/HrcU family type III secretion system export apparatus switch protein n=1 Tax=Microbulbifer sp. ANSA005 TaxID=3243362 RepID=UPI004043159F